MANKKINELDSRSSLSLSDLMAVGDPSTGYLYKTTISDLKTLTGAGVVSFNGRFGSVVPAEGDYSLTQLSDVIITSASNNQVLRYNGSNWVNATIDLSGYVPYTGATGNVNLGSNTLLAAQIKATSSAGLSINANSGTQIADLGAGGGANMTLFGGLTGTSASFSSSVTGNTIVKTGGTSSQFLKADGSVDSSTYLTTSAAASTYLPLTGGTLTGALITNSTITASGLFSNPNAPIAGLIHLKHGTQFDGATGFSAIGATASNQFFFKHGISTNAFYLSSASITTERTYTLPDASGTLALTSQLHDAVTIGTANGLSLSGQVLSLALASTSATGALSSTDWNTFNGKQAALNGTGFVKISGTTISYDNSTYLTTGSAASTYLPLAGGTLTGALNGTSAVFSSTVQASAYRLTGMTAGSGALYWTSDRVTLANYNATGKVHIEANGGTGVATFGGATYNSDFVGTGRFTDDLYAETGVFSLGLFTSDETKYVVPGGVSSLTTLLVSGDSTLTGSVGVGGTATGTYGKLSVFGGISIKNDNNAKLEIGRYSSGAPNSYIKLGASSNSLRITDNIDGNDLFTITNAGNVGIGTTAPESLANNTTLQIDGTSHSFVRTGTSNYGGYFFTIPTADAMGLSSVRNPVTGTFSNTGKAGSAIVLYGTSGNGYITFLTSNANNTAPTEKMSIAANGNVGIGGGDSIVRLNIVGAGATSSTFALYITNSSPTPVFSVRNDGVINTGTAASSPYNRTTGSLGNLFVDFDGSLYRGTASSQRFKENITDWIESGLDTILALKPKTFTYKEDYYSQPNRQFLGLIAEDVAEVSPLLADFKNEDGTGEVENVRYATIVVPLIKAIQELEARIKQLENK